MISIYNWVYTKSSYTFLKCLHCFSLFLIFNFRSFRFLCPESVLVNSLLCWSVALLFLLFSTLFCKLEWADAPAILHITFIPRRYYHSFLYLCISSYPRLDAIQCDCAPPEFLNFLCMVYLHLIQFSTLSACHQFILPASSLL